MKKIVSKALSSSNLNQNLFNAITLMFGLYNAFSCMCKQKEQNFDLYFNFVYSYLC